MTCDADPDERALCSFKKLEDLHVVTQEGMCHGSQHARNIYAGDIFKELVEAKAGIPFRRVALEGCKVADGTTQIDGDVDATYYLFVCRPLLG